MSSTVSAKPLFRAKMGRKVDRSEAGLFPDMPATCKAQDEEARDPLDFDPTPASATESFLSYEGARLRELGMPIWENAVGAGHIANVLIGAGFDVLGSDLVDRGWPGTVLRNFYSWEAAPSPVIVTNPPYCEISAKGHGRWLRKTMELQPRYVAMLLNWDWICGRMNGMDELHERFPVSRVYACCWKIDFRGLGNPAHRNGWIVWDADHEGPTQFHRMFKEGPVAEGGLL